MVLNHFPRSDFLLAWPPDTYAYGFGRPSFVEAAGGHLPYGWVSGG